MPGTSGNVSGNSPSLVRLWRTRLAELPCLKARNAAYNEGRAFGRIPNDQRPEPQTAKHPRYQITLDMFLGLRMMYKLVVMTEDDGSALWGSIADYHSDYPVP